MDWLIWTGAGVTLLGFMGLVACIVIVARAKSAGLEEAEMRQQLQRVMPMNLGALLLSVLGLMAVIVGLFLG
jgi:hypothetical protein